MKQVLLFLVAGLMFGAGLTISGMIDPMKTQNFLDFASIATGKWDPSLLVTFATALIVTFGGYQIQKHMRKPVAGESFSIPDRTDIDRRLIIGPALFGIGWGLIGLCPGPDISAMMFGKIESFIFMATFVLGIMLTWPLGKKN